MDIMPDLQVQWLVERLGVVALPLKLEWDLLDLYQYFFIVI